jgi:hypothetical protein
LTVGNLGKVALLTNNLSNNVQTWSISYKTTQKYQYKGMKEI